MSAFWEALPALLPVLLGLGRLSELAEDARFEYLPGRRPWHIPAEIALPCATQNELLGEDAKALISVGESKPDASLPEAEFAAWTMLANELMNLDEVLNK